MAEARRKTQKTDAAFFRLRKQRRVFQKRFRFIGNRELENILNLEIDKFAADIAEGVILLETLNSLSFRFFSFFDPALLNSPDKSVKVLQDSS
jgi:hypothetical protein